MIDLFCDDLKLERIDTISEGFKLMFKNNKKDETLSLIVSQDEFVNLYNRTKRRCETCNLIPLMSNEVDDDCK